MAGTNACTVSLSRWDRLMPARTATAVPSRGETVRVITRDGSSRRLEEYEDHEKRIVQRFFVIFVAIVTSCEAVCQRCTRPDASPAASASTSATVTRLKSPGIVCLRALAATAN